MRVRVSTKLNYEDKTVCYNGNGIFKDNTLKFKENDTLVVIDFLDKKMVREDDEKKLEYKFLENTETLNSVLLKSNNYLVSIPIYTDKFDYKDNYCLIKYRLVLEERDIEYLILVEVI